MKSERGCVLAFGRFNYNKEDNTYNLPNGEKVSPLLAREIGAIIMDIPDFETGSCIIFPKHLIEKEG